MRYDLFTLRMLSRIVAVLLLTAGVAEAKSAKRSPPKAKQREEAPPVVVAKPAPPPAPEAKAETLESAIELYQNARFAASIVVLDQLLRTVTDPAALLSVTLYLAMNFLAIGNEAKAIALFQNVLDLDPDFVLPTLTSPSIRQVFARVKTEYKIIPEIVHTPPLDLDASNGAVFDVTVKRMRPGYEVKLFYRVEGEAKFSSVDLSLRRGDTYVARLPTALLIRERGYSLEYYIVASEGPDHALTKLRSAASPFVVPVAVPVQIQLATPVYKRWWFWTVIGGAAAAAAVATTLVLTSQVPPTGQAAISLKFL
jgi:hypothetical protein